MRRPFFSLIIPTFNSQRSLEYTLESIKNQSIDKKEIEIIVIDGGSTDNTISVAQKYGAVIYNNPKKLPEYAKAIGTKNATGKYVVRMDSDEEFNYKEQLNDKKEFLEKYPEVKMLVSNRYISGRKVLCGVSSTYINTLGDPFSYFVYNTKIDKITTYNQHVIKSDDKGVIMKFDKDDSYPIADSGTCVLSLDYMKEKFPDEYTSISFICSAYDRVLDESKLCGCLYMDVVRHNCASSFITYLSKLKFRVINNLFHKDESGFSSKELIDKSLTVRKYLFCLYAVLLPLPIIDSVRLALVYKDPAFLLHFVYLYYICIQIVIMGSAKLFNKTYSNERYG